MLVRASEYQTERTQKEEEEKKRSTKQKNPNAGGKGDATRDNSDGDAAKGTTDGGTKTNIFQKFRNLKIFPYNPKDGGDSTSNKLAGSLSETKDGDEEDSQQADSRRKMKGRLFSQFSGKTVVFCNNRIRNTSGEDHLDHPDDIVITTTDHGLNVSQLVHAGQSSPPFDCVPGQQFFVKTRQNDHLMTYEVPSNHKGCAYVLVEHWNDDILSNHNGYALLPSDDNV
jgi:hypothetical protein